MEIEMLRVKDEDTGLEAKIPIRSKYTFIIGNSGTGKSTFVDMLSFEENMTIEFKYRVDILLTDADIRRRLKGTKNLTEQYLKILRDAYGESPLLLVSDEDADYMRSSAFQSAMVKSPYLYLFIIRKPFTGLPYSYKDILEFTQTTSKSHTATIKYQPKTDIKQGWSLEGIDKVVTEDSGSGFIYFSKIFILSIDSLHGRDNLVSLANGTTNSLFILDELGVGPIIAEIANEFDTSRGNRILLIPSFESLVYHSKFIGGTERPIILTPNKEKFYTQKLEEALRAQGILYSKSRELRCLVDKCCYRLNRRCGLYTEENKTELVLGDQLYSILRELINSENGSDNS